MGELRLSGWLSLVDGLSLTLADSLKPVLFRIRAIPGSLGLRPHSVEILAKSWNGAHTGAGELSTDTLRLTQANNQPPKVRWLRDDEIAVGSLSAGTVEIGPVTPRFQEGGLDIADLNGSALSRGDVLQLRITGPKHPDGAVYHLSKLTADKAMHYMIQAQPSGSV